MNRIENKYLKVEQSDDGYIHLHQKNGGVIVLALTQNNEFVLIKTKRPKVAENTLSLEFPRGFKEIGELSLVSAIRELCEETGIGETYGWQEIGFFYPDNGIMDNKVWVMTCHCNIKNELIAPQEEEGIQEIVFLTKQDILKMIADNKMTDGISLSAFLIYLSHNKP